MQRINFTKFWSRYGGTTEDYNKTPFAKALARLPVIGPNGPWVAGGAVRRLITDIPEEADYDFFFANGAQLAAFAKELESKGAVKTGENEMNVAYKMPAADKLPELKIQLIRVSYNARLEDAIEQFDFSLCKCGFDGTDFVFGEFTLFDLGRKRLIPDNITFGVSSIRRMIKYTKQGYTICSGGLTSFLQQIADNPAKINSDIKYID
jgi:hypothetical protein